MNIESLDYQSGSHRADLQPCLADGYQGTLLQHIQKRSACISILGLGYVGLPLARAFVTQGFRVLGLDIDAHRIKALNRGESYLNHLPAAAIHTMQAARFEATTQFERLGEADVILICVPTPLTKAREPDLSCVKDAASAIARCLRVGQLVVLESTTYPGTTREEVFPILAKVGLQVGRDFFLAFSPEREDPGNAAYSCTNIPKVVGGFDAASLEVAATLYATIVPQVVRVSSLEVAEACKILENTYRAVNIALVNELKILYDHMGIDVWEVIAAAKTKPFGFQAFYPGPGLGGHCIPIDPFYLAWLARKYSLSTRFIELAGEINTTMPAYVVSKIGDALNERGKPIRGSKITLLGMAYKKDVADLRESPGLELMKLLSAKGGIISYNDPHIPRLYGENSCVNLSTMVSQPLTDVHLSVQDCVVIVTDHTAYDWQYIVEHAKLVVDTRNATQDVAVGRGKIVRA